MTSENAPLRRIGADVPWSIWCLVALSLASALVAPVFATGTLLQAIGGGVLGLLFTLVGDLYLIKRSRAVWWLLAVAFGVQLAFILVAIRMPWGAGIWARVVTSVVYLGLLFTRSARAHCFIARRAATPLDQAS